MYQVSTKITFDYHAGKTQNVSHSLLIQSGKFRSAAIPADYQTTLLLLLLVILLMAFISIGKISFLTFHRQLGELRIKTGLTDSSLV